MNTFIALIGVILFIGGFVLLALKKNNKVFFNGQIPIIAAGFVLFIAAQCFTIIPTGYTGVRVILGQVQDRASNNGLCWKIPFVENIKLVNNKQQDIEFGNKIWGETSDRTVISYSGVTVTYSISGKSLHGYIPMFQITKTVLYRLHSFLLQLRQPARHLLMLMPLTEVKWNRLHRKQYRSPLITNMVMV